jgi:hypothetical protein
MDSTIRSPRLRLTWPAWDRTEQSATQNHRPEEGYNGKGSLRGNASP